MTRRPEPTPSAIGPLDTLPLFHKLAGRRVVVAGAGDAVRWKLELLRAAGADVLHLAGLAAIGGDGEPRDWTAADLTGAALAIGGGDIDGTAFAAAARSAGVPVNVIDDPDNSDFIVGTIVNRSPVVIAIGTGGASPMLGQRLRAAIEQLLPPRLADWGEAARGWRARLKSEVPSFHRRRAFWNRFADRAMTADRLPTEADFSELAGQAASESDAPIVLFVGAGPGGADNLTLGALRILQRATVILHDDLVSADILELARREAIRISVGKRAGKPSVDQAEINRLLVAYARPGEIVVRLKGGDPLVFGRLDEELAACRAAGITTRIIPGIGAAQAAASSLGVPLTQRGVAQRVQFVTASGAHGEQPDLDWSHLADPHATTALYMPRRSLAKIVARAIADGLDPATPAAAFAGVGHAGEQHLRAPLHALPGAAASLDPDLPLLVLIGAVTAAPAALELEQAA